MSTYLSSAAAAAIVDAAKATAIDEPLERAEALGLLREMLLLRRFEERCAQLYSAEKIRGFLHLYVGEEAVAVGVMRALTPEDCVLTTYRDHGQALARGMAPRLIMAEMFGKLEGCCRGRGGSMHLFNKDLHFYGGNGVVAAHLPLALGFGLADTYLDRHRVTACFFGDGAVVEGEFHECLNLAALWKLPVLFCCENNYYSMGMALDRAQVETNLAARGATYHMPSVAVDGMDVLAVRKAAREATEYIRAGNGPYFLELRTYRYRAHSMYDPDLYRAKSEIEEWKGKCPIDAFFRRLEAAGLATAADREALDAAVNAEIDEAVAWADAGTLEPVEELTRYVYSDGGVS